MVGKRMHHINRYREIASVLLRNGFGMVVEEFGFAQFFSFPQRLFFETKDKDSKTTGERVKNSLQQ
jgi:ubiquinone biosynthesis protein